MPPDRDHTGHVHTNRAFGKPRQPFHYHVRYMANSEGFCMPANERHSLPLRTGPFRNG